MKNLDKTLNLIIMIVCIVLGSAIMVWTTSIQSAFLDELGVSKWGAMTIEPLLIITSFLLGIKITKIHKSIAFVFLVILFGISLLTMVSMYTKKSYTVLSQQKNKVELAQKSQKTEEIIQSTLKGMSDRGTTSSKSLTKAIDQLQKQGETLEKHTTSETLELQSIIETISKLLHLDERQAILFFAIFVSLSAVFSPSFLFFSAGMMIKSMGVVGGDPTLRMKDLSLKQKVILMAKEGVTSDVNELARFLKTSPRVVKSQLSRIDKKFTGVQTDRKPKKRVRKHIL